MHDLVIRNGTIVDGTGADRFHGDVAVDDGVITEISRSKSIQPSSTQGAGVVAQALATDPPAAILAWVRANVGAVTYAIWGPWKSVN